MTLKLRNTASGELEAFKPIADVVKLYVCGVTPYDVSHVGHAMSYVVFDVLRRYLEFRGYQVRHVQNFTDIDDRIITRAERLGIEIGELTSDMIERYMEEMRSLNVLPAHEYPCATKEIPQMIEMIEALVEKGYAYEAGGDVYYRVRSKEDYGRFSHRDLESMMAGARVEPNEQKEHPADFALWKGAKPGEPSWESPWGPGRPGWHIECSAMALRYLGEQIDIHGGGQDLIFPHHENEIAQTEAYTGKAPFVRYWLHNAWVKSGEEKMSKSLGNFIPISEALEQYSADAIRMWVLFSHYRTPLTFTSEALSAAKRGAERLRIAVRTPSNGADGDAVDAAPCREQFIAAMDDDLNTSKALAALFDLAHEINRRRDEGRKVADAQAALLELADVLGLTLTEPEADISAAPFIELLITIREELRGAKQFELADRVRDGLDELGVTLEDGPEGTTWRRRE
ncbi:MAG: cysteine--tRNA ligase [Chloroflexi bacterium]|nr:cysteine--tRNA ligase [Chloroflexota bacterium]MCH8064661.1 cysteine--tRNA ligase [Chloroflexota bacterium]